MIQKIYKAAESGKAKCEMNKIKEKKCAFERQTKPKKKGKIETKKMGNIQYGGLPRIYCNDRAAFIKYYICVNISKATQLPIKFVSADLLSKVSMFGIINPLNQFNLSDFLYFSLIKNKYI